jgi:hypothetical protein
MDAKALNELLEPVRRIAMDAAYAIAEGTSGGDGESGGGTSENNISVVGSEGVIIQVQGDTSVVSHRSNHVQ